MSPSVLATHVSVLNSILSSPYNVPQNHICTQIAFIYVLSLSSAELQAPGRWKITLVYREFQIYSEPGIKFCCLVTKWCLTLLQPHRL